MKRAKVRGEQFCGIDTDPVADETKRVPNFFVALIPLIAIFVVFNVFKLNIILAMLIGLVLALILFAPALKAQNKETVMAVRSLQHSTVPSLRQHGSP